jgi:hypothetical protein
MRYKKQHILEAVVYTLLKGEISGLHTTSDGLTWHDTNTRFHDDRLRTFREHYGYYINNLRGCSSGITKGGVYMIRRLGGIKMTRSGIQVI